MRKDVGALQTKAATLFPDKKKLKDNMKISSSTDTRGIFITLSPINSGISLSKNSKSKSIFSLSASVSVSLQESHLNSSVNCFIRAHLT